MNQLVARYSDRHGRISLDVPDGADFVLVKFPPTGGDPYADSSIDPPHYNASRPAGGTYRLARHVNLSQDLIFSAAFPLEVAWQDAYQATGSQYLPLIVSPNQLAPPEYILPAGIPYNGCFVAGYCPVSVLEQIHAAEGSLRTYYLSVTSVEPTGQWVHTRFAGPQWPGTASGSAAEAPPEQVLGVAPVPISPQDWNCTCPSSGVSSRLPRRQPAFRPAGSTSWAGCWISPQDNLARG
jgi:hypothetical protein